jgi:hypothetical protein
LVYIGAAGVQNASLISTFDDYPNRQVKLVTLESASLPFDATGVRAHGAIFQSPWSHIKVDSRGAAGDGRLTSLRLEKELPDIRAQLSS